MNVPTKGDVDEMDRLRKIMAGDVDARAPLPKQISDGRGGQQEAIVLSKHPTSADISDMAKIMENFSKATGVKSFKSVHDVGSQAVQTLVDNSANNRSLKEALITEKTKDGGVKIGAWEIRKRQQESLTKQPETVYYIKNTNTNETIKAKFLVLEGVRAIIKLLNQGVQFSDPKIKEIVQLEIRYRNLKQKALTEKIMWARAKKNKNELKKELYEIKFDAVKSKALLIKEQIKNIYYRL